MLGLAATAAGRGQPANLPTAMGSSSVDDSTICSSNVFAESIHCGYRATIEEAAHFANVRA